MSVVFSNASLARFAALFALGLGAATFCKLGLVGFNTSAVLAPFWAGAAAHVMASLTFDIAFGLLTTVLFGLTSLALAVHAPRPLSSIGRGQRWTQ